MVRTNLRSNRTISTDVGLYRFMSPRQLCSVGLSDVRDTISKLSESVNDITTLSINHVVDSDNLINMYDVQTNSPAEFTLYTNNKGTSEMISLKQERSDRVPIGEVSIKQAIMTLFDFTESEIEELGLMGCLHIARECDPTATSILEALNGSTYMQSHPNEDSILSACDKIDDYNPSYGYVFQKIYNFSDALFGIKELVVLGDFSFNNLSTADVLRMSTLDELCAALDVSEEGLFAILHSQQYPGSPARNILDCLNYQSAKRYNWLVNDSTAPFIVYRMNGDETTFRVLNTDGTSSIFLDIIHILSEESICSGVLQKALALVVSGQTGVADLAAYLGQGYESSYSSAKDLISTISSFGNDYTTGVAQTLGSMYSSMANASPVSDTEIEWGTLDIPVVDTGIGSVIIGVVSTAAEVIGSILVFAGGAILKVLGGMLVASGYIVRSIAQVAADVADTFPDFIPDTVDRMFGYPLFQKDNITITGMPDSLVSELESTGSAKLFYPWMIIYIYKYNSDTGKASIKIFLNTTMRSSKSSRGGYRCSYDESYQYTSGSVDCYGVSTTSNVIEFSNSSISPGFSMNVLKQAFNEVNGYHIDADPCEPEFYDTGSTNGDNYQDLWSNAVFNAVLALLGFSNDSFVSGLMQKTHIDYETIGGVTSFKCTGPLGTDANDCLHTYIGVLAYIFGLSAVDVIQGPANPLQSKMPNGARIKGITADWTINTFLPWISSNLNSFIGSSISLNFLGWGSFGIVMPWSGLDPRYAVTPPRRKLASLIFAAVLTVAIVAVSVITFVVARKIISRKLQPRWLEKVEDFAARKDELAELPSETDSDIAIKRSLEKQYLKDVRRFNLFSSLLGMGTYNPIADWYEGSGTIGGSWALAADSNEGLLESLNSSADNETSLMNKLMRSPDSEDPLTLDDLSQEIILNRKIITGR